MLPPAVLLAPVMLAPALPSLLAPESPFSASPGVAASAHVARIGNVYRRASQDLHLQVAGIQSGLLGAGSDAVSQAMHGVPMDGTHVLAMGILGAVLSGAFNAKWLQCLEEAVPGSSSEAVLKKTVLDYCIAGVLANSAYLIGVPALTALMSGASPAEAFATGGWTIEGFRTVMLIEACTFGPYNLCAFRLVPPRYRPLSAATVSATCTVALSGVTLGFGVW